MEVHHHPQLEHKPKPWKEYILEGLMIFIAVTMGFFAESLREHISNNDREKHFIHSLISDLKDDTANISGYIKVEKQRQYQMDSLISFLNDPVNISKHGNEIYYWGRLAPRLENCPINMRTIEQLRNSGSFRLISNMNISNSIVSYYEKVPLTRQLQDVYAGEFVAYKKTAENVFEASVFRRQETPDNDVIRATDNPPLQKNAPEFLKALAIDAVYMNGSRKAILANDKEILKTAKELLAKIKEEYHLKE